MADLEHLKILKRGVKVWNKERVQKPNLIPNLSKLYLTLVNLKGANLQGACLQEADLRKAPLNNTSFREANLQDADLTGATSLLANQFAGANLSRAKLPEEIVKFEGLSQVKEISQRAQKLFLSILLGCVYCWLTIATTTDLELITNSGSSPLPIIQTKIPIATFYWAAPLILLSLYFWFHLYLQRLWEDLSELPAVFPDGRTLDKKVHPWLISGMVRSHVQLLKAKRPALSRTQGVISWFLAWWLVPITFLAIWARYIPRHDETVTYGIHIAVLTISFTAAWLLRWLARNTLRGKKTFSVSGKEIWTSLPAWRPTLITLSSLGFFVISFYTLSYWVIEGDRPRDKIESWEDVFETDPKAGQHWYSGGVVIPQFLKFIGSRHYANLEEADISTKPPTWTDNEENLEEEISQVKGAMLKKVNLENAFMSRAFLVNANLRGANLQKAGSEQGQPSERKSDWHSAAKIATAKSPAAKRKI